MWSLVAGGDLLQALRDVGEQLPARLPTLLPSVFVPAGDDSRYALEGGREPKQGQRLQQAGIGRHQELGAKPQEAQEQRPIEQCIFHGIGLGGVGPRHLQLAVGRDRESRFHAVARQAAVVQTEVVLKVVGEEHQNQVVSRVVSPVDQPAEL